MSQQSVVPGVHRNKGVKMCPKCREDPLPLFHKQEVEAESDQLLVASPPSFLFFVLKSSVCVFFLGCYSEVRRVLFSLLRRL